MTQDNQDKKAETPAAGGAENKIETILKEMENKVAPADAPKEESPNPAPPEQDAPLSNLKDMLSRVDENAVSRITIKKAPEPPAPPTPSAPDVLESEAVRKLDELITAFRAKKSVPPT